jgi:hypothetical protein
VRGVTERGALVPAAALFIAAVYAPCFYYTALFKHGGNE